MPDRAGREQALRIAEGVHLNVGQQCAVIDLLSRPYRFAGVRVDRLRRQRGEEREGERDADRDTGGRVMTRPHELLLCQ